MSPPRPNKQEQVYESLRERVLSGEFGPGYRLVIDRIAEEFGMSALPVREAIRRLEAEGLVSFKANAGAQVAPADPSQFADGMAVLATLEGYATAEAAPRLGEEDLARLESLTDEMEAAIEDLDAVGFSDANRRFHQLIYEHCGNPFLEAMLFDTVRRLDAIRSNVFTHILYGARASTREHREMVEMFKSGATARQIERVARAHKIKTVDAFRDWQRKHEPDAAA